MRNVFEYYMDNDYLEHHGIKGQKWGVRRFQNPDGTWTDAGKKRYLNEDGTLNERGVKRVARQKYRKTIRELNKQHLNVDAKHDQIRDDTLFGFDSGGVKSRFKGHLSNEYNREQAHNKLNQKAIDARREYRTSIGKKRVDTFGMKILQSNIKEISNMSQGEFNKQYAKHIVSEAANTLMYYNKNRNAT